jgi:uncharacterized protein YjbJ (UPF0337 family)
MNEHNNKSSQARKGLIDSVKGKAKEIVGAVTGNDSLTAEGQLEQAQAQERKDANSVEAVADAEATQAHDELAAAKLQGAQGRIQSSAKASVIESAVQTRQDAQKHAAEVAGQREAAREKTQAELDAHREVQQAQAQERQEVGAAAEGLIEAAGDHHDAIQEASDTQNEADRIRRQADNLNSAADLP